MLRESSPRAPTTRPVIGGIDLSKVSTGQDANSVRTRRQALVSRVKCGVNLLTLLLDGPMGGEKEVALDL